MTDCDIPPEPVVTGDGIKLVTLQEQDVGKPELGGISLGKWECHRCEHEQTVAVSNGEVEEPHECAGCQRQGPFTHAGGFSDEQLQAAIRADDMWHPPTDIVESDRTELWQEIREFIHEHWDAKDSELYDGLTAYALSTWFRPNLTFVPHIMIMGKTTGGKTRLLNTLSQVSYRAVMSASATPASLFRMIDAYNVSFFVSEYHGLSQDAQRQLDNVVRAGQKRGEKVTRAEQSNNGYEPLAFDPFAHIGIATQYNPDDDIINRCVQIKTRREKRNMPATIDKSKGEAIRNKLLYHRFDLLHDSDRWKQAEQEAYSFLAEVDIRGRTREKLLSLVTVAILWDRLDSIKPFVQVVVEQDREAESNSEDAQFVQVVRDLLINEVTNQREYSGNDPYAGTEIPHQTVKHEFHSQTGIEKSGAWVGQVCSRLDIETKRLGDGTVISDPAIGTKLKRLCDEHNLPWEASDILDPIQPLPPGDKYELNCSECGEGKATHRVVGEGHVLCEHCADEEQQGVTG